MKVDYNNVQSIVSKQDQLSMERLSLSDSHKQQRKSKRLLLFPLPLQGHINPMLQLANILYSKGFSITVIHTNFNSPNPSSYPHLTFHSIPQGLSHPRLPNWLANDVTAPLVHLNISCINPFQDALVKMLSHSKNHREEGEPIACLITDAVWYFTQDVADGVGLPRIVLRTSNVSSFVVYDAVPPLRDKGYFPIEDTRLEELIPETPPLKVKDLPQVKTQNQEDFFDLISTMLATTKASSGLIWNSCEDLERDALNKCDEVFPSIPIFHIGPFHKYFQDSSGTSSLLEQDQSCISWLDTQHPKSVLYISFGSIVAITETQFLEIAWGLANSKQPFLWVVRPGSVHGSEWLGPLPDGFHQMVGERGNMVKWAPQEEVLSHPAIGGFWTHCGWNSLLESICEGVPMICHPSFGDQKINARYVSDVWRIGMHLEYKLERGEIERVINTLMVEKEGQEIQERATSLKEKVGHCLKRGGSSYQSLENLIRYISSL